MRGRPASRLVTDVSPDNDRAPPERNQLGTFGGVFTPSILTILGVIMFMGIGFVNGQAGIGSALLILLAAKAITLLTSLSISAIATNTQVEGGGAYFLISRSLGPSYGGAIGLALFLAQALSVPFYVIGFAMAVVAAFPSMSGEFISVGFATATLLLVINYFGANLAIKAQYFILAVLMLSIVVFLGGALGDFSLAGVSANWAPEYTEGNDFWVIFAIFFPAVTGIMAGVNMSGDLKSPARSIPKGTLLALGVGALIYAAQIIITGGAFDRAELTGRPYQSLLDHAAFHLDYLVVPGVFAATLSSALGSFLGAPRILQALARDDIFPFLRPFAKGSKRGDEPIRGYILTYVMTLVVLLIASGNSEGGALNAVAAVLTMFFLYTYGMTNMAAFIEQFGGNPSFRPRFRAFHWVTALAGAAGCTVAAVLINPLAALAAAFAIVLVFVYTERRVLTTTFGDARRGFFYSRARTNLFKLSGQPPHPKNWRPTTLVLSGDPQNRRTLAAFALWLEARRGIVTLAQVLIGDFDELLKTRDEALRRLNHYIDKNRLQAFSEVLVASSFDDGVASLLQTQSIGPLKPNLVMMGWPGDTTRVVPFARLLRLSSALNMSQIVVVDRGQPAKTADMRIDIWWRGQENGSLMVILAYLLTLNWEWSQAKLRVLRLARADEPEAAAYDEIQTLIEAARISAEIQIVHEPNIIDALRRHSSDASVVLLGFRPPSDDGAEAFHASFERLTARLPTTLLVSSSGEANLLA